MTNLPKQQRPDLTSHAYTATVNDLFSDLSGTASLGEEQPLLQENTQVAD